MVAGTARAFNKTIQPASLCSFMANYFDICACAARCNKKYAGSADTAAEESRRAGDLPLSLCNYNMFLKQKNGIKPIPALCQSYENNEALSFISGINKKTKLSFTMSIE